MRLRVCILVTTIVLAACSAFAQLGDYRVRLPLSTTNHAAVLDTLTGSAPAIWQGMPARFEIGIYDGSSLLTNLSNLSSMTMEVYNNAARSGPAYLQVVESNLWDGLSPSAWDANGRTNAHAVFELRGTNTDFDCSAAVQNVQQYWAVWYVTTTGATDYVIGSANLMVHVSGAPADAVLGTSNPNFRITAGGKLQIRNNEQSTWHDIYIRGSAGSEYIVVSEGE